MPKLHVLYSACYQSLVDLLLSYRQMRFFHRCGMIAVDIMISHITFTIVLPSTQDIFSPPLWRGIEMRHWICTETVVLGDRPARGVRACHEPHGIFYTPQSRKPSRRKVHCLKEFGGKLGIQLVKEFLV